MTLKAYYKSNLHLPFYVSMNLSARFETGLSWKYGGTCICSQNPSAAKPAFNHSPFYALAHEREMDI